MLDSANNDLSSMPLPVLDEALPRSEREDACSAPFISDIVNGIASMYASKQDDDAFADRLASTANRITSTPAPVVGKGDYYNKTDNSVPFYPPAPTGFLKTASTSALAAKKMISLPEEKENEESESEKEAEAFTEEQKTYLDALVKAIEAKNVEEVRVRVHASFDK